MPPLSQRTYVSVILRVSEAGVETPQAIILPDGRRYEVGTGTVHHRVKGGEILTVHVGPATTHLYKDTSGWNGSRWFVVLRDVGDRPAFAPVEGESF